MTNVSYDIDYIQATFMLSIYKFCQPFSCFSRVCYYIENNEPRLSRYKGMHFILCFIRIYLLPHSTRKNSLTQSIRIEV